MEMCLYFIYSGILICTYSDLWYELPMQSKQEMSFVTGLGGKGELQDKMHRGFGGATSLLPPCFDTANR